MRKSDIFENFVKIAREKGLISEAEGAEHTEKDFSESNIRMDSLSIEQISKLYNTKPSLPKDMEYKNNIMEDAHPDPVILSPSHDKLNGLVESEVEGQNIRMRIVMKEPDGHLVQRKYAEKNLILSLVRIANDLDNNNQEDLRKLADTCLLQATTLKKTAFVPIILGVAALLGALYAKQHLRFHSDGFEADYQKAIGEINDLLNSNSNLGVGYSYTPAFLQVVSKLRDELSKLYAGVHKILPVLEKIETPRTGKELAEIAQHPESQQISQTLDDFKNTVSEVYPYINGVINSFNNPGFKQRAIQEKGILSSIVDSTEVLHGGAGLIADDFDDVRHALQTLKIDIDNIVKGLTVSENLKQNVIQQLQATKTEQSKLFDHPQSSETEIPQNKNEVSGLEEEGKGIISGFFGK